MGIRGELFSLKLVCEERTYFFNVKENRLGDIFLSVVESKESELSSYERHSIVVFQENLDEFMSQLTKIANDMKKIKPARLADKLKASTQEAKDGDSRNHTTGQTRQSRSGVRTSGMVARNHTGSEKRVVQSRPTGARNVETPSRDTKSPAPRKRPVVRAKKTADKDSSQP